MLLSIDGLTFGTAVGAFTISGSALTIGAGGITHNGTQSQIIRAPLTIGANQIWNPGTEGGASVISNNVTLSGGALGATGFGGGGSFSGSLNISADSFINMTSGSAGAQPQFGQ